MAISLICSSGTDYCGNLLCCSAAAVKFNAPASGAAREIKYLSKLHKTKSPNRTLKFSYDLVEEDAKCLIPSCLTLLYKAEI